MRFADETLDVGMLTCNLRTQTHLNDLRLCSLAVFINWKRKMQHASLMSKAERDIIRTHLPVRWLFFEENRSGTGERRVESWVQENCALSNGLQRSRSFEGEAQANEDLPVEIQDMFFHISDHLQGTGNGFEPQPIGTDLDSGGS